MVDRAFKIQSSKLMHRIGINIGIRVFIEPARHLHDLAVADHDNIPPGIQGNSTQRSLNPECELTERLGTNPISIVRKSLLPVGINPGAALVNGGATATCRREISEFVNRSDFDSEPESSGQRLRCSYSSSERRADDPSWNGFPASGKSFSLLHTHISETNGHGVSCRLSGVSDALGMSYQDDHPQSLAAIRPRWRYKLLHEGTLAEISTHGYGHLTIARMDIVF